MEQRPPPNTVFTSQEVDNKTIRWEGERLGYSLSVATMRLLVEAMTSPGFSIHDGGEPDSLFLRDKGLNGGYPDTAQFAAVADCGGPDVVV